MQSRLKRRSKRKTEDANRLERVRQFKTVQAVALDFCFNWQKCTRRPAEQTAMQIGHGGVRVAALNLTSNAPDSTDTRAFAVGVGPLWSPRPPSSGAGAGSVRAEGRIRRVRLRVRTRRACARD